MQLNILSNEQFQKIKKQVSRASHHIFDFIDSKGTGTKYLAAVLLTLFTWKGAESDLTILVSFLELFIIFLLSNLVFRLNKYLAQFISVVLMFFYNVEQLSLLFAGTYVSPVMLSNVDSLEALSGRMELYVLSSIGLILFSLIPISPVRIDVKSQLIAALSSLVIVFNLLYHGYIENSPHYNWFLLWEYQTEQAEISRRIREKGAEVAQKFYQEGISDGVKKPTDLVDKPNLILIFAEGLSQSIIEDERDLLPELRDLQQKSITFDNYYNHTFATYAGLIGQLYSGYQFSNFDSNSLESLESILEKQGYHSAFVNTEPSNKEFTAYLKRFNYDELVTKKSEKNLTDKEAYDLLWKTATDLSEKKEPFFISIYTFGTHLSLDSPDKKFGDGKDPNLNKFYNMDVQLGDFLEKFNNSPLADNTILVFTTDHATYVDDSYLKSFGKNRAVGNLDKVPLSIYYKGVTPQVIDVNGKNSLNLSPTILDFLDISEANYFLGSSLFSSDETRFDRIFYSEDKLYSTVDGKISFVEDSEKEQLKKVLEDYFAAKLK